MPGVEVAPGVWGPAPTALPSQRCTCRAPSSRWSTSPRAIGELLPAGESWGDAHPAALDAAVLPTGGARGASRHSRVPPRRPPQPLRRRLLPDQAQDPPPARHRAHLGQRPAHPDAQTHPQVPPHLRECGGQQAQGAHGGAQGARCSPGCRVCVCVHTHVCPAPKQGSTIPKPRFLKKTVQELCVGTFRDVAVVPETAPIYTALEIFVDRRVSALPVINAAGTQGGGASSAVPPAPFPTPKPPPEPPCSVSSQGRWSGSTPGSMSL